MNWPATQAQLAAAGYEDLKITEWCHCGPVFVYRDQNGLRVCLVVADEQEATEVRYRLHDSEACRHNKQVEIASVGRCGRGKLF